MSDLTSCLVAAGPGGGGGGGCSGCGGWNGACDGSTGAGGGLIGAPTPNPIPSSRDLPNPGSTGGWREEGLLEQQELETIHLHVVGVRRHERRISKCNCDSLQIQN